LSSASWLVADLSTGQVLAARAGSAKRAPASTQKILTALTFGPSLPTEIEVTTDDTKVTGRTVGLRPGVRYRASDLLDALFVASGNDVALALARTGGNPASAGDRMTATAAQLGATDTTAYNPTGLDADGQLTTPYDLAVLTRAALDRPEIRRAAGLSSVTFTGSDGRARHLSSTNPLLGHYPGALGMKTGSTADAGQTFVGAAERDGKTLAVVLMQAPSAYGPEATRLLDWGFSAAGTTSGIGALPPPAGVVPAPRSATDEPAIVTPAEDGGGVSPLLALALALTVVAAAFTYWQGNERLAAARRPGDQDVTPASTDRRVIRLPEETAAETGEDAETGETDDSAHSPSSRESRRIFAP
jgi:D-alanyl-D-alanine carboxypeptidase (penicillin-binding protein 5/6)